jgi:putative ATP-dependent endonuclease of the OLD family
MHSYQRKTPVTRKKQKQGEISMAVIRHVEVHHFRALASLSWLPSPGINCLIGPGDSGKSTMLDAIDLCIGAKRTVQITDSDFHRLDHDTPIQIRVTVGDLPDSLKGLDTYGLYLHGFDPLTGEISPEPGRGLDTVLTIQLLIESDLEPQWSLVSERAAASGQARGLSWTDRVKLAPTRLGAFSDTHLSWRRGSILNKLCDERADASKELAAAARDVRAVFGEKAKEQLAQSLELVTATARSLGVPVGAEAKAMLDASSISFSGGTISLHDEGGIPLHGLGLGSARLLIAGLQRCAAAEASIVLIDELEHGLEPHRIIRLLDALGAKEPEPPLQVFMTTHSPVAVRELSGAQLYVLRNCGDHHEARLVGVDDAIQGTVRKYPEALLATSVLVCEGASEVGLMRGLDQYRIDQGEASITACGTALIDGGGEEIFKRARVFQSLGYRTAVLRDSDVLPTPELEAAFRVAGGSVFCWGDTRALEDELFLSLSEAGIDALLNLAIDLKERELVDAHLKTASGNAKNLVDIELERLLDGYPVATRTLLGKASRKKEAKRSWFKSVSAMQAAALEIIGPDLPNADPRFQATIADIFVWIADGGR